MQQQTAKYYFRKKDYNRIKNWYQIAKNNYIPQDTNIKILDAFKTSQQNIKYSYFKYRLQSIELQEAYCLKNLKKLNSCKQIILLSNIYHRDKKCVLSYGKEIVKNCYFDINQKVIKFDSLVFFFYLQALNLKEYYFCLQLRLINQNGQLQKLGSSKHALLQQAPTPKAKFILRDQLFGEQLALYQTSNQSKLKSNNKNNNNIKQQVDVLGQTIPLGSIQVQQQFQQIKNIDTLLPTLTIIDNSTKLGLATELHLHKKKDQLILDPQYKLNFDDLILKIQDKSQLHRQLIQNNPFTLSHKDMIQLQIKQYSLLCDMHNGWKFINKNNNNNKKNILVLDLVIENQKQIYLSSKSKEKNVYSYYQSDNTVFLFKIKGIVQQKRSMKFMIGWLPLAIDLSLLHNKIDLFLISDLSFPDLNIQLLNVKSTFSVTSTHPLYQKYKNKTQDRKIAVKELPFDQNPVSQANLYVKLRQRTKLTDFSTQQIDNKKKQLQNSLLAIQNMIQKSEIQRQNNRLVELTGLADMGQIKINQKWAIDRQQCVGRILNVRIQLKSVIPQTDCPSSYYLPKKAKIVVYLLRNKFELNWNITQNKIMYHVPVNLNTNKQCLIKLSITSLSQFQLILNSRLVLVIYEEDNHKVYAKSLINIQEILGYYNIQHVSFLKLINLQMMNDGIKESCYGTIMANTLYSIEKTKPNYSLVDQYQISKDMHRLSADQRLKMRIGNYKGDKEATAQLVSKLKQKKHMQFITNTIQSKYYSQGQIYYQLGQNSYYLLQYTNEDKSQNNIFTFHLDCPYAQLITDQSIYRQVIEDMNIQKQNYKKLKFIYQNKPLQSYYETQLLFNQSIGLLIKLNYIEISSNVLKKIELLVKRNTLEAKRFVISCKYKQPLIWDYYYTNQLIYSQSFNKGNSCSIPLNPLIEAKYREIHIFNPHVHYDSRNKQLVLGNMKKSHQFLLMQVMQLGSLIKKNILYEIKMLEGTQINLTAGRKTKMSFPIDLSKSSIQIIRCYQREVNILKRVNFTSSQQIFQIATDHFQVQFLRDQTSRSIVLDIVDIYDKHLSSYLLKCNISISKNTEVIEIINERHLSITLSVRNPYGCPQAFEVISSNNCLSFQDKIIVIGGYESKNITGRIDLWIGEPIIYCHFVDRMGNLIKSFIIKKITEEGQHLQSNDL